MIDLSRAQCPICGGRLAQTQPTSVDCTGCGHVFPVDDDIAVLKADIDTDTALDLDEYEATKPPNPKSLAIMFGQYRDAMQRHGITGGACLEIGSGTGNLTIPLVEHSTFAEIHCSDISPRFLSRLRAKVPETDRLRYWIFDAGALPFQSGSMDAVFAQSVLHHILEYEAALKDVHRVLRPGGIAVFGEPTLDAQAIISFLAGLIAALEEQSGRGGWTQQELTVLKGISRSGPRTGRLMREHRAELAPQEDKHMFVISDLQQLGRDIGFQEVEYRNAFHPPRIGAEHKTRIQRVLTRYGVPPERLAPYQFVFDELSDTFGVAMGTAAPCNFGYFIFRK